jgi:HEAT repeat protein
MIWESEGLNMAGIPLLMIALTPIMFLPGVPVDADELRLRAAGIDCSTASLIAYLDHLTGDDRALGEIDELVRRLGAHKFQERESASNALLRLGSAAKPALQKAKEQHADAEIRSRAAQCLRQIEERETNKELPVAAVRLLARRGDSRAIGVLLRCLPTCEANSDMESELGLGLYDLAARSPTVPPELIAALRDPSPARRAIAGCIVARRGTPAQRAKARLLLKDPLSTVRLRTAQGLLGSGDKPSVPTLIDLLVTGSVAESWQADELLHWIAGGSGPDCGVCRRNVTAEKCHDSWQSWWRQRNSEFDFAAIIRRPCRPGLFTVWESSSAGFGPQGIGCDGTPRVDFLAIRVCAVGQFLPNGRLLALGHPRHALNREDGRGTIFETDWSGHVFSMQPDYAPVGLTRDQWIKDSGPPPTTEVVLRNGHRVVLDLMRDRLIEYDLRGRAVGEALCRYPRETRLHLLFPLLRLGFDDLPERDYDLRTSIAERIRELESANVGHWALAADAFRLDLRADAGAAVPAMFKALGRSALRYTPAPLTSIQATILSLGNNGLDAATSFAQSKDELARAGAIRILGLKEWGRTESARRRALVKKALRDSTPLVRREAVQAAASLFRENEILPALTEALKDGARPLPDEASVAATAYLTIEKLKRAKHVNAMP